MTNSSPKNQIPIALTIAGSDPSCGAGAQRDLLTFSHHHVFGLTCLTTITAQNSQGTQQLHYLPPQLIQQQLHSLLNDFPIHAIKISMIGSTQNTKIISQTLQPLQHLPLVLDPILYTHQGTPCHQPNYIQNLQNYLLPQTTLLTPNIPEAEQISQTKIQSYHDLQQAAKRLLQQGPKAVLIKTGHLPSQQCNDYFLHQNGTQLTFQHPKLPNAHHTRGTGCTLSSAITANLARGQNLIQAVQNAQNYLQSLLQQTLKPGHGTTYLPQHTPHLKI